MYQRSISTSLAIVITCSTAWVSAVVLLCLDSELTCCTLYQTHNVHRKRSLSIHLTKSKRECIYQQNYHHTFRWIKHRQHTNNHEEEREKTGVHLKPRRLSTYMWFSKFKRPSKTLAATSDSTWRGSCNYQVTKRSAALNIYLCIFFSIWNLVTLVVTANNSSWDIQRFTTPKTCT